VGTLCVCWNPDREAEFPGFPAPETLKGTGFHIGRGTGRQSRIPMNHHQARWRRRSDMAELRSNARPTDVPGSGTALTETLIVFAVQFSCRMSEL
jgi:hypothetical protein